MGLDFSRKQWLTIVVIAIADFCNAICVALQAPFYPQEAEKKDCTATEYGLVFGVFELIVFLVSPVYGAHLNRIGPKLLFNGGILTTGTCAILFGMLDKVEGHVPFITLSFIIRIVEAMGNASFLTASFAIIAKEFPNNVATMFASLEAFFGLGLIVGPTLGGALYSLGGYTLPFAVLGSALFCAAVMSCIVLPKNHDDEDPKPSGPTMLSLLKIPGVMLSAMSIICTSMSIGFLQATLEPHLRQFNFSPMVLGLMFVINGGVYALSAPCWGWLCDHPSVRPKYVIAVGSLFVAAGFLLVGPAPFFDMPTIMWVTILGLVLHGLGMGSQLVASFSDGLGTAIASGLPNSIETYGLVSGMWTSTFALGAFIGPTVSGLLFDSIGFRNSTVFVFILQIAVELENWTYFPTCDTCRWERVAQDIFILEMESENIPQFGQINKWHPQDRLITSIKRSGGFDQLLSNGLEDALFKGETRAIHLFIQFFAEYFYTGEGSTFYLLFMLCDTLPSALIAGWKALLMVIFTCIFDKTSKMDVSVSAGDLLQIDGTLDESVLIGDKYPLPRTKSRRYGISVERSRPPAMNSLIACSSYKNRRSPWSQRTPRYRPTYGSLDHRYRGAYGT